MIKEKFITILDKINFDLIYKWATFVILPFFIISPVLINEIFFFYLILAILKVTKDGYKKSGLEIVFCIAMAGLFISAVDEGNTRIFKNCLRVARIISLPILMYQYKPIKELKNYFIILFGALAIYGLIRINAFPIVSGYSEREYCFSNFFMNSSLIAFSGYVFFLTLLLKSKGKLIQFLSTINIVFYLYLIAIQQVRGSYLTFAALTPVIVILELKTRIIKWLPLILAAIVAISAIVFFTNKDLVKTTTDRVTSIFDKTQGSNRGRLCIWKRAVEVFKENPINGVGYKRFNKDHIDLKNKEYEWAFWHAHNEFLCMLAETGIVGIITWLIFKISLLWLLIKNRKSIIGAFILYLFIAFEFHNIFEVYLFERVGYVYVYLLIGLCLSQSKKDNLAIQN
ncbi:MAG: O-antigen ligase family protein [Kiritimatiellae bacterium]|jgi:O-antigen ligase|nr:O-antigen ligase family protein [Kiritimatiellia bacterium]